MSGLPTHVPSERERADLELLCVGALAPLDGFEGHNGLVTLETPADTAQAAVAAGRLVLLDPEGASQATVHPDATFAGTDGLIGLVGSVEALPYDGSAPFARLRLSPEGVRDACGDDYLLVPVQHPLTSDDLDSIAGRAGTIVFLVMYGLHRDRLAPSALVRSTLAATEGLPNAHVVVVPVVPRLRAGGIDARDEALVRRVVDNYTAAEVAWPSGRGALPGQERAGASAGRSAARRGIVLFFTGLSGSGKSTVARAVQDILLERHDREVTSLDGDVVRRNLSEGLGFSAQDRDRNIRRIGWVAAEIARHGGLAIASPIAPFDATRQHVRAMATGAGGTFVLVHVATPLEECERRDRKGLYARARAGGISDFTGISSPYEEPRDADIRIDTTDLTVAEAAEAVITHLDTRGLVDTGAGA